MTEIQTAFLVCVILLVVLSTMSMGNYWRSRVSKGLDPCGYVRKFSTNDGDKAQFFSVKDDPTHTPTYYGSDQGFKSDKKESMVSNPRQGKVVGSGGGDWQEEIQNVGIDPATFNSHKEWTSELLGKTTGSSKWSVLDHDNNVNPFRGLRHNLTYKNVYAQPGARVTESNDWQDMPAASSLRWRCHDYPWTIGDPKCPWPPGSNPEDTYAQNA